jgi:hypothetical protein
MTTIYVAPHELAGGDQCPVLSPHEQGFITHAELVALGIAPVAIGAAIRGRNRLRGALGVITCALLALGACFVGLFAVILLGACGS